MTLDEIQSHANNVRRRLGRIYDNSPYKNFSPVKDIFSIADDLCELVIALAENQTAASALPPPSVTVTVEQPLAKEPE